MSLPGVDFWIALMEIIGVNIVLSGDNAVVIALAARGLPARQQKAAVAWGSGAAVLMRIVLTIVAVELLRLPYLKLVGAALLLWIAVQLLQPEDDGDTVAEAGGNLASAIKTILIADLVMSLDNVIAVAAAAKDSITLLVIGLAISIPLVVFASTLLLRLMSRFPIIITIGAALLGWVAGEMGVSDPVVKDWVNTQAAYLHMVAPALGAAGVVALGTWLARRAEAEQAHALQAAAPPSTAATGKPPALRRIVLAADGSEHALVAARRLIAMLRELRDSKAVELHIVNVQPSLPGDVSNFVDEKTREDFHHERSDEVLASVREVLSSAGQRFRVHRLIGDPATSIAALAESIDADLIVMGTRGLGAQAGALLGSVAQRTVEHATVPVLLTK